MYHNPIMMLLLLRAGFQFTEDDYVAQESDGAIQVTVFMSGRAPSFDVHLNLTLLTLDEAIASGILLRSDIGSGVKAASE